MKLTKIKDKDGFIILSDENGNTGEFEFIDMTVIDGREYAVLLQTGDDMVTILRFEEGSSGDRESYYTIDDDDIFDKVFSVFKEEFGDEFDFE